MATTESFGKDITDPLDAFFNEAETLRKQGLQEILAVQAIKKRHLANEKQRLAAKLGEDHPRVRQIADKLDYDSRVEKGLGVLIDESGIRASTVDERSWQVEGRILDAQRKGVKGLAVSLFGENGHWVRQLGYSCSDGLGFYVIKYPQKKGAEQPELELQTLVLTVSGKDYKVLYQHQDRVTIRKGQIDVRNVMLSSQESVCTPPQPETDDAVAPQDIWTVKGQVTDPANNVVAGATVRLRDERDQFGDKLATTKTDEQGRFTLTYRTEDLPELVRADPDLYIQVSDEAGKALYSSTEGIKFQAGRVEVRDVKTTAKPTRRKPQREDKQDKDRKPTEPPKERP